MEIERWILSITAALTAVLIHTGWSRHWGTDRYLELDNPHLTEDAVDQLVASNPALVGIDALNIDNSNDPHRPAHHRLLGADIPIVEHGDTRQWVQRYELAAGTLVMVNRGCRAPKARQAVRPFARGGTMARHRARSVRLRTISTLLITAVLTVGTALVGVVNANAILIIPDNKTVSPKNSDVFAKCILQVKKVDPSHNYATTIKLSGQAQPNNQNGYVDNVFTQVDCWIMPSGDTNPADALAQIHPNANSATVFNTSTTVVLPFANSYTLCGSAFVKLVNGDTSYTPYVCA